MAIFSSIFYDYIPNIFTVSNSPLDHLKLLRKKNPKYIFIRTKSMEKSHHLFNSKS